MKLTKEEGQKIVWDEHDDWKSIETGIIDTSRWSITHQGVFEHKPTGNFYKLSWIVGATEYQDELPFEYTDPDPIEVRQVEVLVKKWVAVAVGA